VLSTLDYLALSEREKCNECAQIFVVAKWSTRIFQGMDQRPLWMGTGFDLYLALRISVFLMLNMYLRFLPLTMCSFVIAAPALAQSPIREREFHHRLAIFARKNSANTPFFAISGSLKSRSKY
jgi:hypothetical protein